MSGFQYLVQVNICLLLFYGFYVLMLRRETFFMLNRIYLVSTAIFSFLLPLLQSDWLRSLFVTEQVYQATAAVNNVFYLAPATAAPAQQNLTVLNLLVLLYLAGCCILAIRFFYQLYRIKQLAANGRSKAYSFFRTIVVAPDLEERETIQSHEEIHVKEWHSADVIFFELVAVVNWFNPVVYAYRKSIKTIHEYIADEKAAQLQPNKEAYAMLLMSNTFGIQASQLTNSFYKPSLLKRRINMLFKSKSRKIAILKYGLSAPLFLLMLILSAATIKTDKLEEYSEILAEESAIITNPLAQNTSERQIPSAIEVSKLNAVAVMGTGQESTVTDTTKKPLYVVDGKIIDEKLVKALDVKYIKSVNVIKDKSAVEKYGKSAQFGAIELQLKGLAEIDSMSYPPKSITVRGYSNENPIKKESLQEVVVSGIPFPPKGIRINPKDIDKTVEGNVLVVIDGKAQEGKWEGVVANIPPESIASVTVLKDAEHTKVYGEKGKNGVLVITTTKMSKKEGRLTYVDELPHFPGGQLAWEKFVEKYEIPEEASKNNVKGRVIVSFVVEADGSLSDIKSVRDLGFGTGAAAVKLLKRSPKWTPGTENGKAVRMPYTHSIAIR